MDKSLIEELKVQLIDRKQHTLEQLQSIGSKVAGTTGDFEATFPDYGDSMEDNAAEVADYTKNLSLEKDLEKELADINKAIGRIDAGTYGTCSHCGKEIEVERLKIRPESGSCVECKKALKNQL